MYVFFVGGQLIQFAAAVLWNLDGEFLVLTGKRNHEIARVRLVTVQAWCYDNEEITHWYSGEHLTPL